MFYRAYFRPLKSNITTETACAPLSVRAKSLSPEGVSGNTTSDGASGFDSGNFSIGALKASLQHHPQQLTEKSQAHTRRAFGVKTQFLRNQSAVKIAARAL